VVLLGLVGCGSEHYIPVQGTVSWNQRPLIQGSIRFVPEPGTKGPVVGTEINNGKYALPSEQGLRPGAYRVEIRDRVTPTFAMDSPEEYRDNYKKPQPKSQIPVEYHEQTTLRVTADPSKFPNEFDFPLSTPVATRN